LIRLAKNRDKRWAVVHAVMKFQIPLNRGKFLDSWRSVSFSRRTLLHGVAKLLTFLMIPKGQNVGRANNTRAPLLSHHTLSSCRVGDGLVRGFGSFFVPWTPLRV